MKVQQTCIACKTRYPVLSEQLEADCLYHVCPKCRLHVRQAAKKDADERARVPASTRS